MTTALILAGVTLGASFLVLFLARFLGFWRDVPRVDYCDNYECVKTGRCYSGDCE